jgi:outer membrane protein assembly factor BamB
VLWKADVGSGESSPLVVGDRVFLLSDGVALYCLDAATGEPLWTRTRHARPDAPEEAAMAGIDGGILGFHRLRPVREAIRVAEHRAKVAVRVEDRKTAAAELVALREQAAVLEPDAAPLMGAAFENASGQNASNISAHRSTHPFTWAIATPCSDGRLVYAWLPTGVLACYDLNGVRRWLRIVGDARCGGGWYGGQVAPSPLLVDGKIVVHYDRLYCLDAATGATVWTAPVRVLSIPSPVAAWRGGVWYVALAGDRIVRLSDGAYVWGTPYGIHHDVVGVGSPVAADGVVHWVSHAVELPEDPAGAPRLLWELKGDALKAISEYNHVRRVVGEERYKGHGMGWHGYGSPVLDGGVLYWHHESGLFSALDAASGEWLYTRKTPSGGGVYPALTLAGGYAFATGSGGVTTVLPAGRDEPKAAVGRGVLADMGGNALVFSGSRLYARAQRTLYCIASSKP